MALHQDRDERDLEAPIVSVFSLGLPAIFLFGGAMPARTSRLTVTGTSTAINCLGRLLVACSSAVCARSSGGTVHPCPWVHCWLHLTLRKAGCRTACARRVRFGLGKSAISRVTSMPPHHPDAKRCYLRGNSQTIGPHQIGETRRGPHLHQQATSRRSQCEQHRRDAEWPSPLSRGCGRLCRHGALTGSTARAQRQALSCSTQAR